MKTPWKLTEACGGRFYIGHGKDNGLIIFWPDRVEIKWNGVVSIAAAQGAGNRTAKLTIPASDTTLPELDFYYCIALTMRGTTDDYGNVLPQEPTDAELENIMKRPWGRYGWYMLHAMINGDYDELQKFTDATRLAQENPGRGGIYDELETAIRQAAEQAGEPPTKKAVFETWSKGKTKNQLGQKEHVRVELRLMGFGWLPLGVRGKQRT